MFRRGAVWLCAVACVVMCVSPWSAAARPRRVHKHRAHAVSASYIRMRTRWHARAPRSVMRAFLRESPRPSLLLVPVGDLPRQRLLPAGDDGGFDASAMELASLALADKRSHATHSIEPRLLDLMYGAVRHFRAPLVHVISGYREEQGGSRHAQGRAVDIVLPGVSDRQLAAHLRKAGFVGVGIYPRSGFVHLDLRAHSYFWTDSTAPGQASRARPMLRQTALRQDALARKRGVVPIDDNGDDSAAEDMEAPPEEGSVDDSPQTTEGSVR